jgi:exosortase/archaeosortase family protein
LVPTTATLAAKTLNLMGYATVLTTENGMPTLQATGALGTAKFSIAWPCAGIESFLIYLAVALLFLQQMQISWKAKTGFFVFGVIVTYFINVLRITEIFIIGMQYGVNSTQVTDFHSYYGPLYSITWIMLYPIVILISISLWQKRKMRKHASDENFRKPQPTQLNPV